MTDVDRNELGKALGLFIPSEARIVGLERTKGIDDAVFVKLEMPQAAWAKMMAGAPFKAHELVPENRAYLEPDHGFWDPGTRASLRATQVSLPNARFLNVGVDEGPSGQVTVYLMNHGT